MAKAINHWKLSETLALTECKDGFWLYDTTRGMNLSMRAKEERSAFMDALHYYQKRLAELETEHNSLRLKVDSFVSLFVGETEEHSRY